MRLRRKHDQPPIQEPTAQETAAEPVRSARQLGLSGSSVGLATQALAARAAGIDVVGVARAAYLVIMAGPLDPASPELAPFLERGITMAVEGPLADSLGAADALVAQQSEHVAAMAGVLFAPLFNDLRQRCGGLGPLNHLDVRYLRPYAERTSAAAPHDDGRRTPRALFDLGIEPIAAALVLAAATPRSVRGLFRRDVTTGADFMADVEVGFDRSLRASIHCGWHDADPLFDLQASGPQGVVRVTLWPQPALEIDGDDLPLDDAFATPDPLRDLGYTTQLIALCDDLAEGHPPTVNAAFGRAILEVIAGAYRSDAGTGAPVTLPVRADRDRPVWDPTRG